MHFDWDCVVVGGGAAGLSAALVLGRARRRTLVLDAGGQSNLPAEHVGGLLGHDGTPPAELYARARRELSAYETIELRDTEAVDARAEDGAFGIALAVGAEVSTRALVLATGMDYELPDVPGFREHWGGAVFHCPFCHGWELRDRPLAICASPEAAEQKLPLLRAWSEDLTVIDPADVARVRAEDGKLRALVLRDGSEVACDGVLVEAPLRRRGDLPERLGLELTDSGLVAVDAVGRASVPGIYAAGDLAVAPQQVALALGSGHLAGVAVTRDLLLGHPGQSAT